MGTSRGEDLDLRGLQWTLDTETVLQRRSMTDNLSIQLFEGLAALTFRNTHSQRPVSLALHVDS